MIKPLSFGKVKKYLIREFLRDDAFMIPLRLFIGVGWIRASLEKLIEPGWQDGSSLADFLAQQIQAGHVAFPFYQVLIKNLFIPNSLALSWMIMVGQLLVGIAVLVGFFTNLAILCGLFMNFNFILAGEINPSAFYIVIQLALFVGSIGAIAGIDQLISRKIPLCFLVAQRREDGRCLSLNRATFMAMALLALVGILVALPHIRDFSPHSVEDPAMILLVLSTVIGLSAAIKLLRLHETRPA